MSTEDPVPALDPKEVAAVDVLKKAMGAGYVDIPNIGRATILEARSDVRETFPPSRTTILTIELKHKA